ncbi:MAG: B12-binding domain-containing radical SAM protein [Gammaproteobacteria bacterium]|nr:B12-binding domain-containing radical SAM protein [Gammaproteobacteria bacterium]
MNELGTRPPRVLLIGPYDPHCGEYTFLAPPLGVWRLAGVLESAGAQVKVFDPNCCTLAPQRALEREILQSPWDVIGVSTTGMTLRFDLELAYFARRLAPAALLVAGGMEATFRPELMFELGPFDLVVLGEGERPLTEIVRRLRAGEPLDVLPGTAAKADGAIRKRTQPALSREELRAAIFGIPYERMPYPAYWSRLEHAYRVGQLPSKAAREARLAEVRSVRLITLNYCPMGCTFCSATNFLHESQGRVAAVARLEADECVAMIERIVAAHPGVRTIIFQDDIFAFTQDRRVLPLCEGILAAKERGALPRGLQFISTNRIDAMSRERLAALRGAGFRVLGFGIESFSRRTLAEFNKAHIHRHIEPVLSAALELGITPFLDLILSSPRSSLEDVAETVREAYRWLLRGCEIGIYPYVIPFSGAAFARDASLAPHTTHARRRVAGTDVEWDQPAKILPIEPAVREAVLRIEGGFESSMATIGETVAHLPSRVRSLVWILSSLSVLADYGIPVGDAREVRAELDARLPQMQGGTDLPAVVTA